MSTLREFHDQDDFVEVGDMVDELVRNYPQEARSHYLKGVQLIKQGWAARGAGYADTVTEAGANEFNNSISKARESLLKSVELDADNIYTYEQLVTVFRAQGNRSEAERFFNIAKQKQPNHIGVHQMMQLFLSGRWFGSDVAVLNFARLHSQDDASGELACLIPMAHVENWVFADGNRNAKYFKTKAVRKEIKDSFKRFLTSQQTPEENVRSRLEALQYYACVFSFSGDRRQAKKAFKAMKGSYSDAVWRYWNNPEEMFVKFKWAAGA